MGSDKEATAPGRPPWLADPPQLNPEGKGAIYLCQHAIHSKATLRNGAAEVAGGFLAWQRAGHPIEKGRVAQQAG
jgi:hypothetical protein